MDEWTTVAYGPAPRPRRTGRIVVIVIAVVFAVCCVVPGTAVIVNGMLHPAGTNGPPAGGGNGSARIGTAGGAGGAARIGDAVRDGQFEFVVHSVTCGQSTLDNGWLHAEAKGQFCVAELTVRNIGRDARNFGDGLQRGIGTGGERYSADTGAGVVANGSGAAVWGVVNPGIAVTAKIVYDIPAGAALTALELHDSGLSRGVTVST